MWTAPGARWPRRGATSPRPTRRCLRSAVEKSPLQVHLQSANVLATFDRLGPRSALAPSQGHARSFRSLRGGESETDHHIRGGGRPSSAAFLIASHVASMASPDTTPGFLNRDGEPTSLEARGLGVPGLWERIVSRNVARRGPRPYGPGRRRAPAGERGVLPELVGGAAAAAARILVQRRPEALKYEAGSLEVKMRKKIPDRGRGLRVATKSSELQVQRFRTARSLRRRRGAARPCWAPRWASRSRWPWRRGPTARLPAH